MIIIFLSQTFKTFSFSNFSLFDISKSKNTFNPSLCTFSKATYICFYIIRYLLYIYIYIYIYMYS